MSNEEKQRLKDEFIDKDRVGQQRLFHLNQLLLKKELFEFIPSTSEQPISKPSHKRDRHGVSISGKRDIEQIVFSENENNSLNRVVVMHDLMNEAFSSRDKEATSTMNLLMTKLSHYNNLSVLIACHEFYPKGPNSVLLREQLTGIHLHSLANSQKARNYVYNYLTDYDEIAQYNQLFKELFKELFEFIASTSEQPISKTSRKRDKHGMSISGKRAIEQIVFSENENNSPNRVVVMDDLMNEAFNSRDKEVTSTMNLLMTKLSHHNNLSVLIFCNKLYPKGPNSVLLREQLTGIHLHSVANSQKARNYVCNYLAEDDEKAQYNQLFKEHVLDVVNGVKRKH